MFSGATVRRSLSWRQVAGFTAIDSGPGQKHYALRGLQAPGEAEVALYYDEIPISGLPGLSLDTGNSQLDLNLWDVERIEVLRGPEGTLYGDDCQPPILRPRINYRPFSAAQAHRSAPREVCAPGPHPHHPVVLGASRRQSPTPFNAESRRGPR